MRLYYRGILLVLWINLTACSTVGNVVPQQGPRMENVYDSMGHTRASLHEKKLSRLESFGAQSFCKPCRDLLKTNFSKDISPMATRREFVKIPNPELTLYIYPHLAGSEQLPVPGYRTVFDAYDQDHFNLVVAS